MMIKVIHGQEQYRSRQRETPVEAVDMTRPVISNLAPRNICSLNRNPIAARTSNALLKHSSRFPTHCAARTAAFERDLRSAGTSQEDHR
jgi:hypothetical protein